MINRKTDRKPFDPDLQREDAKILAEGVPLVVDGAARDRGIPQKRVLQIMGKQGDDQLAELGMTLIRDNSPDHLVTGNVGLAVRSVLDEMSTRRD